MAAKRPVKSRAERPATPVEAPATPAPAASSRKKEAASAAVASELEATDVRHADAMEARERRIEAAEAVLQARQSDLERRQAELEANLSALGARQTELETRERRADNTEQALRARYDATVESQQGIADRERLIAQREGSLAGRESQIAVRERLLIDSERDAARRLEEATRRERDLDARAQALEARDEDIAIREAAVDEAMSLADESLQSRRGATIDDTTLLEGADLPIAAASHPAARSAAPAAAVDQDQPQADAQALAEERRRVSQQAAEEHQRMLEEGEHLLDLARAIPSLESFVPRVQKALSTSPNATVLLAFYNMAVRQLAEQVKAAPSEDRVATLEGAVAERQKALDEAKEHMATLKEDFDRHRNRVKAEQETFASRANEELLRRIVPAVDNFERALAAAAGATHVEAILSGVKMIQGQFEDILAQEGLVPVKAVGLPFDPRVHEALMEVSAAGVEDDTVVEEVQRGYYLGGKLFRPSLVKVARAGAGGGPSTSFPPSQAEPGLGLQA